jgi:hypothetical protein
MDGQRPTTKPPNLPLLIFKGNSADRKILGFNDYRDRSVDFQSFPREQLVALEKKDRQRGLVTLSVGLPIRDFDRNH